MGFHNSLNACFTLHELNHSHWAQAHSPGGYPIGLAEDGIADWRERATGQAGLQDRGLTARVHGSRIHEIEQGNIMRTVVVGASSGLGRCIATGLAEQGGKVALLARRRERLEKAVADAGDNAFAIDL